MDTAAFFRSVWFTRALYGLGGLIVLLTVFQLGVVVGFHKARFSYRWAENYHRTFGGPRAGLWGDVEDHEFMDSHGLVGTVIKVDGTSVVVKGSDGLEKVISTTPATTLERGRQVVQLSDLKVDDKIVVLGSPQDDGSIAAKFIRIFDQLFDQALPPPPPSGFHFKPLGF